MNEYVAFIKTKQQKNNQLWTRWLDSNKTGENKEDDPEDKHGNDNVTVTVY